MILYKGDIISIKATHIVPDDLLKEIKNRSGIFEVSTGDKFETDKDFHVFHTCTETWKLTKSFYDIKVISSKHIEYNLPEELFKI